jgi:hypothetical protein
VTEIIKGIEGLKVLDRNPPNREDPIFEADLQPGHREVPKGYRSHDSDCIITHLVDELLVKAE